MYDLHRKYHGGTGILITDEVFRLASKYPGSRYYEIIRSAVDYAASTIMFIQSTIDHEVIIVGGGVAINHPQFVRAIRSRAKKMFGIYGSQFPKGVNLVFTKMGLETGIVGAASFGDAAKISKAMPISPAKIYIIAKRRVRQWRHPETVCRTALSEQSNRVCCGSGNNCCKKG